MDRTRASRAKTRLGASRACLFGVLCFALGCATSEKHVKRNIPHLYSVSDPQFVQTMGSMLGPSIVNGNRFEALLNGDAIFPAMLSAIEGARQTITFETYIYWSGVTGKRFAEALAERARSGVKVHVLLDWLGLAITAAERSIHLSSAYFVPDEMAREALVEAVKRGVKVQIITPGEHIDIETVRRASRARWGDLLEAGVEIFEYQPTMYHCKMMIVDERFVSVGSTNFDPRSFALNDEANLNIVDGEFARQQVEVFRRDLSQSRQLSFAQWRERPFVEKLVEHTASLLGSQL